MFIALLIQLKIKITYLKSNMPKKMRKLEKLLFTHQNDITLNCN